MWRVRHVPNFLHKISRPLLAAATQIITNDIGVVSPGVCTQVNEGQRPFALIQIAKYLLAVNEFIPNKIEQVVANLKCRPEMEAEPYQRIEFGSST